MKAQIIHPHSNQLSYWRLDRADFFWRNPLDGAHFQKVTDWEGTELDASISHDGKFVAFLADRAGTYDTWITQVGSGQFRNVREGRFPSLLHEALPANADALRVDAAPPVCAAR